MTIIEVRNPAAFDLPEIIDLFGRAFMTGAPAAPDVALAELRRLIAEPSLGVLVGREAARMVALAVIMLPSSPLFELPTVYHFYADKEAQVRPALIRAVVEWVQGRGYHGLRVLNGTGKSDAAWSRAFRPAGRIEKYGSAFTISFGSQDGDRAEAKEQVAHERRH